MLLHLRQTHHGFELQMDPSSDWQALHGDLCLCSVRKTGRELLNPLPGRNPRSESIRNVRARDLDCDSITGLDAELLCSLFRDGHIIHSSVDVEGRCDGDRLHGS